MPRFRLDVEYDGSLFAGWQRQAGQPSVQQAIEQAIVSFCGEQVSLRGAGRTDAGVHATGQVAHVDLAKAWPNDKVRDALNARLKDKALHYKSFAMKDPQGGRAICTAVLPTPLAAA